MAEPGRVADHVGFPELAVGGHDPLRDDPIDRGADQLDVGSAQVAQPVAVVLEDPLAHGGIVGERLLDQVLAAVELRADPAGQQLTPRGVALVDAVAVGVGVVGVDAVRRGAAGDAGVPHDEAEPAGVEGQVAQGPPLTGRHRRPVHRVGEHPLRGALIDGQRVHVLGDRRGDLEPAGAGADQGEPLPTDVEVVGPPRRVERRPGEGVHALDVREPRDVQRADGTDDEPGAMVLVDPFRIAEADEPRAVVLVPHQTGDGGAEPAVRTQPVLVEDLGEVVPELGLPAVVLAPVVTRPERVAVLVAAHVDPGAGVPVLPPGPPRTVVLVDDGERQSGLGEADAGEDARLAAADHDDRGRRLDLLGDLVAPGDGAGVDPVELQVLEEHRDEPVGDGRPGEEGHQLLQELGGEGLGLASGVPVLGDDGQCRPEDLSPLALGQPALELRGGRGLRQRPVTDPRRVPGHVHQRAQQGGRAEVLEHRGDDGVVIGERHPSVRVPLRGLRPPARTVTARSTGLEPAVLEVRRRGRSRKRSSDPIGDQVGQGQPDRTSRRTGGMNCPVRGRPLSMLYTLLVILVAVVLVVVVLNVIRSRGRSV